MLFILSTRQHMLEDFWYRYYNSSIKNGFPYQFTIIANKLELFSVFLCRMSTLPKLTQKITPRIFCLVWRSNYMMYQVSLSFVFSFIHSSFCARSLRVATLGGKELFFYLRLVCLESAAAILRSPPFVPLAHDVVQMNREQYYQSCVLDRRKRNSDLSCYSSM